MAKRWYVLVDTGECTFVSSRKVAIRRLQRSNKGLVVDGTNVMTEPRALRHPKHLAAVQSSTLK